MKHKILLSALLLGLGSMMLTACDQGQKPATTSQAELKKFAHATILEGVVSNDKGAVNAGIVEVMDESGHMLAQTKVDNSHYRIEVPANTLLPILLTYSSGPGAEKLMAVAIYDTVTNYFINPSTTAIAKAAKAMGGYTRANMIRAAEETVHTPDANKTTTGWRGDPTTQYGGWH
ncbi:MAG: hypothetical protein NTV43_12855 [Methylococcales bacterium]|nr:hypothetical protein [Methylococcales bacterium]